MEHERQWWLLWGFIQEAMMTCLWRIGIEERARPVHVAAVGPGCVAQASLAVINGNASHLDSGLRAAKSIALARERLAGDNRWPSVLTVRPVMPPASELTN